MQSIGLKPPLHVLCVLSLTQPSRDLTDPHITIQKENDMY